MLIRLGVEDGEAAVDEVEACVHAGQGGGDVGWDFVVDEVGEEGVGLGFGARGVEEGGGEDVHALDVDGGFGGG